LSAALLDDARDIASERVGQPVLLDRRVLAVAYLEIDGVDARSLDVHENLRGIRQRGLHAVDLHDLRTTKTMNSDFSNLHIQSPFS
jgi:hypothetical protein